MGSTLNLLIKYRPVRIGLLVRAGNLDDLTIAAGLNTLLAGGIYNPIIPISTNTDFAEKLIESYNVDVLHSVADTSELHAFREKYPFLVFPYFSGRIFLEDWETKKNVLIPLDVLNIIEHYSEEDFRHKSDDFQSNCGLVEWTEQDPAKYLFAVTFGFFPTTLDLRDDFAKSFLSGLRAKPILLQPDAPLDPTLTKTISPIRATSLVPRGRRGGVSGGSGSVIDGIVVGDENRFEDLVYFWNLRAAGYSVEFLPKGKIPRFKDYIQDHLNRLDEQPSESPHFEKNLGAHVLIEESDDVQEELKQIGVKHNLAAEALKSFHTKKNIAIYPSAYWALTHSSSAPVSFFYDSTFTLANVDKTANGYSVTMDVRNKPMQMRPRQIHKGQELIASVNSISELAYEDFTLKFPHIRALNHYFSAKAAFDPFKIRLEKGGVGVFIDSQETSLTLFPVPHEAVIKAVFEYAGIQPQLSKAGLITKRILEKLGGLDEGRVFKVRGVRQLIHSLKKDDSVSVGEAERLIRAGGQLIEHENLFIAGKKAKFPVIFEMLLKKDIFRAGLEITCDHCKLKNWLSLRTVDDFWPCEYCGHENQTSLQLKEHGKWKYRKSGLFSKDNHQEGAIPVILTLLQLNTRFRLASTIYTTSLDLIADSLLSETDFCILSFGSSGIEVCIGECKSEGGAINEDDVNKLMRVREKLKLKGIDCYLIFSKTADAFRSEEIELFRDLADKQVPCILFTNKELEPYEPYERYLPQELPDKYAMTFKQMAINSAHVYLKSEPNLSSSV